MLNKSLRLRKNSAFRKIFSAGKSYSGKFAVLYVLKGEKKIGFVASKKVGNAVQRNRAKRMMREIVRLHLYDIKEDVQIILIARSSIKDASYKQLESLILYLFKKAKLLV